MFVQRVEFSTDFELHKPVDADRGNHRGKFHFGILAVDKDLKRIYLPGAKNDKPPEPGSLVFSVR
jgi:hypothetical protein